MSLRSHDWFARLGSERKSVFQAYSQTQANFEDTASFLEVKRTLAVSGWGRVGVVTHIHKLG